MHRWKHTTLILFMSLGAAISPAIAEDAAMPVAPAEPAMAGDAGQPVQPLAFPKITPPGQPIVPVAPATDGVNDPVAPADATALDDEEAPAPDAAAAEPFDAPAPQEAGGVKSPTDKIVDHFMTLDTDGSKSVSVQEYLVMVQQRVEARFKAMDANGDGEITEEEYREFWKGRMAKYYRLQR